MAHVLSITDGTTTVSLTTTNCILGHYVPQAPKRVGPGELDFDAVSEPVEVTFTGASTGAIQTAINGVERLLLAASRRQALGVGPRVFLQFQPIGDGTLWRSELRDGSVKLENKALTTFGSLMVPARLLLTRAPWWEGSRTQIPLTNGNGSNNTSGLTIRNHDDGTAGDDNYLGITAANVAGVLPTPLELQLTNTNGATVSINAFYLANNAFDTGFTHILEGENRIAGYGSVGSAGTCSNGQFLILSGTGTLNAAWSLSAALLQQSEGRYVHLLARIPFFSTTPGVFVRASIRDANALVTLAAGQEVLLQTSTNVLQDLGTLPLPPGGYNTAYGALTLFLQFRCSVSETINLDYIQLTPADELCYRQVVARDTGHEANSIFVDDGIEGLTYKTLSGTNAPLYAPRGTPLHLFPGRDQRLYVLMDGTGASIDKTMSAKAYYRPRRLTL